MDDTDEPDQTAVAAAETFSAVGNAFRLDILDELYRAEAPVAYSELREALGERDTGRLNYHLNELVGEFVWKDEGVGYGLNLSGKRLVSSVISGRYREQDTPERVADAPGECVDCGATALELRQPDGRASLRCTACGVEHVNASFPVGAWKGRPADEVPAVFDRYIERVGTEALAGVCPECMARMRVEPRAELIGFPYALSFECERCPRGTSVPYAQAAYRHPRLRAFLHRAGVDTDRPFWTVDALVSPEPTTVRSEDPVAVTVRFDAGDAAADVDLAADGTVTAVRTEWAVDG